MSQKRAPATVTNAGEDRVQLPPTPAEIEASRRDPLDLSNYHLNRLPQKVTSTFERHMARVGGPLALLTFMLIYFWADFQFLKNIDPSILGKDAKALYEKVGAPAFEAKNVAMLAVFAASLVLWITEAVPNYLTSLMLIVALVLTGVLTEVDAYHQLGHQVMWLNILSFVLASMLVKTGVAKRFALWFIVKFGKNASLILLSFIVINLVLSAFISATAVKAAILLPIFMIVAAIYGATGGKNHTNFGRNIVLQNLFQINIGASAFLTGSGANLLAIALISSAVGSKIFYSDWLVLNFPVAVGLLLLGWLVGSRFIFPLKAAEKTPQIEGGMERLKDELQKLGPIQSAEIKSVFIFLAVLALWSTDRWHGISATAVAFLGAVVALTPGLGVVKWNDVEIPWHLLLFSAGAYTLGEGLQVTDLPVILVDTLFRHLGFNASTPFWMFYLVLTGAMLFSAILFQSKTMRTLIFVPIAIGVAKKFGFPILSLALPVAFLIEHVYVLPFNSKPAALLYLTDHYSWSDSFKYGFTMMIIAWIISILMAMTYFRMMGITPDGLGLLSSL
ncbi:DASS family sodium-coupled anion symporter [candidate division KSB1 bacterium]|nr:DASS family sodium-coupled anion symporter [candidate division KSB1 bacterium]